MYTIKKVIFPFDIREIKKMSSCWPRIFSVCFRRFSVILHIFEVIKEVELTMYDVYRILTIEQKVKMMKDEE